MCRWYLLHSLRGSHSLARSENGLVCYFVTSRDEEQLIRSILTEVRNAMPATLLPAKQQYGLEESMQNVLKILNSVSVLGLVGMGGIGKTTLALEIYNHAVSRRQFERHCFLKDVRSSEPSELQPKSAGCC
jgi:GTPase SAR1 family protein